VVKEVDFQYAPLISNMMIALPTAEIKKFLSDFTFFKKIVQ